MQLYYQIALLGRRDLAHAPTPQQGFEMTLLRMLAFKPNLNNTRLTTPATSNTIAAEVTSKPAQAPQPEPISCTENSVEWRTLLPKLELSGMAYALAANCSLANMTENKVELSLSAKHQPMLNQKLKERIAESLSRYLKRSIQLDIAITSAEITTPIKLEQHEQEQQLTNAKQTLLQDPKIKRLIDMYDATMDVSLV